MHRGCNRTGTLYLLYQYCMEIKTIILLYTGLRYDEAVRRDEAGTEEIFEAGQKLFEELLEESSRFNDNQTLSKTHKYVLISHSSIQSISKYCTILF